MWRSVSDLRSEIRERVRFLELVFGFNFSYDAPPVVAARQFLQDSERASASELPRQHAEITTALKGWMKLFGCPESRHQDALQLLHWIDSLNLPPDRCAYLSKYEIEQLFQNFALGQLDRWDRYPPHTTVFVSTTATIGKGWKWTLPEKELYVDMCLAYNDAVESSRVLTSGPTAWRHAFYLRSAILSAYYFVEAYLNGVAFDCYAREKSRLDQDDQDSLLEWDSNKKCKRYVSIDDKLAKYPRIILARTHLPAKLHNSVSRKVLLTAGKEYRDSIVHHSPLYDLDGGIGARLGSKTDLFNSLDLETVTRIVDAAVVTVREINAELGDKGLRLEEFATRSPKGIFELDPMM